MKPNPHAAESASHQTHQGAPASMVVMHETVSAGVIGAPPGWRLLV